MSSKHSQTSNDAKSDHYNSARSRLFVTTIQVSWNMKTTGWSTGGPAGFQKNGQLPAPLHYVFIKKIITEKYSAMRLSMRFA